MPTVITEPGNEETYEFVRIKTNGYVKCLKSDGDYVHYPPHRVRLVIGDEDVRYQSPHGRI